MRNLKKTFRRLVTPIVDKIDSFLTEAWFIRITDGRPSIDLHGLCVYLTVFRAAITDHLGDVDQQRLDHLVANRDAIIRQLTMLLDEGFSRDRRRRSAIKFNFDLLAAPITSDSLPLVDRSNYMGQYRKRLEVKLATSLSQMFTVKLCQTVHTEMRRVIGSGHLGQIDVIFKNALDMNGWIAPHVINRHSRMIIDIVYNREPIILTELKKKDVVDV